MSLFKKIVHHLKRQLPSKRNGYGHKRATLLNPFTHGYHTARKVVRGVRRGRALDNVGKVLTGVSRRSSPGSIASSSYNAGNGYVYSGKTLSELMR